MPTKGMEPAPGVAIAAVRTDAPPADAAPQANDAPQDDRHPEAWWLRAGVGPYLVMADVGAFLAAALITRPASAAHLSVLAAVLLVHAAAGLYRSRLALSLLDDVPYLLCAVTVGFVVKLPFVPTTVTPVGGQVRHVVAVLAALFLCRFVAYTIVRQARCRGWVSHRTVILGMGALGERLACSLLEHRNYGLRPIGFVDSSPPGKDPELLPLPLLGPYDRLAGVLREHRIRDVIVAFGETDEHDLVDILQACDRLHTEVFVVPRLYELHSVNRYTDDIWGIPVMRLREPASRNVWWPLKRVQDLVLSAVALLLLSPLMALCALAVRIEGGPGVIFRQQRVGLDGRPFDLYKFRSLKPADDRESQTQWNIRHDSRMGPVGRFLRSTSLDELPQLVNILRGDMSVVGPRPERPHFVEQFSEHIARYPARHRVPAGLTGWAQVHGLRGDTSIEDRARFDNFYIANWSPWLDCKIILRTIGHVVAKKGG